MAALLLLLALLPRLHGHRRVLRQVHLEPRPRLLLVPLEPEQVGFRQLVIRLRRVSRHALKLKTTNRLHPSHRARATYSLLVRLVHRVQRILYRDPLHVPHGQVDSQREVEVDFLDGRRGEVRLEDGGVLDRRGRDVELPAAPMLSAKLPRTKHAGRRSTYHPVFCVLGSIFSSTPSFSASEDASAAARAQARRTLPWTNVPRSLMFLTLLFFLSFGASFGASVMMA